VDIWALGVILYTLATGARLFTNDLAMSEYYRQDKPEPISVPLPSESPFWQEYTTECIREMLRKDWNTRPSASELKAQLTCYREFSTLRLLRAETFYPSYSEWKSIWPDKDKPSLDKSLTVFILAYGKTGVAAADIAKSFFNGKHDAASVEVLLEISERQLREGQWSVERYDHQHEEQIHVFGEYWLRFYLGLLGWPHDQGMVRRLIASVGLPGLLIYMINVT
jgi:serine/threonine protein kinase